MARQSQALKLSEIGAADAALALAGLEALDPAGLASRHDVRAAAEAGRCFRVEGDGASAVYVLIVRNGCAWVESLRGSGPIDWCGVLDSVITTQAEGLASLAFQTARPGLVRQAKKRGWRVSGWIMKKDLRK